MAEFVSQIEHFSGLKEGGDELRWQSYEKVNNYMPQMLCGENEETVNHLFLHCKITGQQ